MQLLGAGNEGFDFGECVEIFRAQFGVRDLDAALAFEQRDKIHQRERVEHACRKERGGERYVPDQEIKFDVTPRNLNFGR